MENKIYILAWCKTLAGFQTYYATMSRCTNASTMSPGEPVEYFLLTWSVRNQLSLVSNSASVSLDAVKHPSYREKTFSTAANHLSESQHVHIVPISDCTHSFFFLSNIEIYDNQFFNLKMDCLAALLWFLFNPSEIQAKLAWKCKSTF